MRLRIWEWCLPSSPKGFRTAKVEEGLRHMIADTITNTYPHYFKILPNDDSHLINDFRMLAVNAEAREVYLKK